MKAHANRQDLEDRYRRKATIITTNLDYDEWYHFLNNRAMVDALLSRLRRYSTWSFLISGVLLITVGILTLTNTLNWFP